MATIGKLFESINLLIEFTNFATNVIESGYKLDVVYTDFQNAFDRVHHSIILNKLSRLGVHSSALSWIKSYLFDREQYVMIDGLKSKAFNVTQGLGPLLFVLFMIDVLFCFKHVQCLMYADDIKVFRPIKTFKMRLHYNVI